MSKLREFSIVGMAWVYWFGMTALTRAKDWGEACSVWMPVVTGVPIAIYTTIKIVSHCRRRNLPACKLQANCDRYAKL